jgi:CBS domain-containing protein
MTICPDCGHENIDGADECEKCSQSLSSLSKPRPTTPVERSVMKDRVESLVPREPLLVAPDTPVQRVLQQLVARSIGCAVIVADREVVGIFTERDALDRLNVDAAELGAQPVSAFMTSPVQTVGLDDRVAFALHKMDLGGYRHLPVTSEGRIIGYISVRNILNHLTAALRVR